MQEICLHEIETHIEDTNYIVSLFQGDVCNIRISYDSDFPKAKILRDIVDTIAKEFGISPKWRTRLVLIVDELNNNAIEYGSKTWDTNYLSISLNKVDSSVEVNISSEDAGTGAKTKTAVDMEKMREESKWKNFAEHHSIRGRWLFLIISHLVDELYFKDAPEKWLIVGFQKKIDLS